MKLLWIHLTVFCRRLREGYSLRESWSFGWECADDVRDLQKAGKVWLSWYFSPSPIGYQGKQWLMDGTDWDTGDKCGHVYTTNRDSATRYTREEALKLTPKYDGSSGIEKRSGIERA